MTFRDKKLMSITRDNVPLFYPYVSNKTLSILKSRLKTRWIGQGPIVEKFENLFSKIFLKKKKCISTGSGTDALHLAYLLADIKKDDEVITPVFTCTATNIPLLYIGAKIKFCDIEKKTMNICVKSLEKLITKKTKAIVCVHYGGMPCNMDELIEIAKKKNIKIIEDAAHALGAEYKKKIIGNISDITIFSFQAIKHITTGDGGMLCVKDQGLVEKAKRLRWFGIDRNAKLGGIWENDVHEIGYKYQMNDIAASMGLAGLSDFKKILAKRRDIYSTYLDGLSNNKNLICVHDFDKNKLTAAWLFTILVDKKNFLQDELRKKGIETNQVHFRNDKYSIFKRFCKNYKFPNMDEVENKYLVLPLHNKMTIDDAKYVVRSINNII